MKKKMVLKLKDYDNDIANTKEYEVHQLNTTNTQALGRAFFDAYLDTIDYEGESVIHAIIEVSNVLKGVYGVISSSASGYILVGDTIASAIFVTEKPDYAFIPYIFTRKQYLRKGMAKYLVLNAIQELLVTDYNRLELFVTDGNTQAEQLYKGIGFEIV